MAEIKTETAGSHKFVNVATMFANVDDSYRELLLAPDMVPLLKVALEQIDPDSISPKVCDILNFARYGPIENIRAVILAQDPYPDPNHAHGLCFSSRNPRQPDSYRAILQCLQESGFISRDSQLGEIPALLTSWAAQGVLLLNMALTTKPGKAGAHLEIWKPYVEAFIKKIGVLDQSIAWLLWGGKAQEMKKHVIGKNMRVLTEIHPSPLAQAALPENRKFKHCKNFLDANEHLCANARRPIEWNPIRGHIVYTDGSCSGNGTPSARAGYAAYFTAGPMKSTRLTGRIAPYHSAQTDEMVFPSNIRGEGFAIVHALERAIEFMVRFPDIPTDAKSIEFIVDLKHWWEMVEMWIPGWVRSAGSATEPNYRERLEREFAKHKNADIVMRIWTAVLQIRAVGATVRFRHVYSHNKNKHGKDSPIDQHFNGLVDKWAGEAQREDHFFDKIDVAILRG